MTTFFCIFVFEFLLSHNVYKALKNDERMQLSDLTTNYIPIIELSEDIWSYAQLSLSDKYHSKYKYPPFQNAFNHMIERKNQIEWILNENKYNIELSDIYYKHKNVASTGMYGEYWKVNNKCIQHKLCNVYFAMRVLHKSKTSKSQNGNYQSLSCQYISKTLVPIIKDCIDKYNLNKCPLLIENNLFFQSFKVKVPHTNHQYVNIKITHFNYTNDTKLLLGNIRESILLHYLRKTELKYMEKYGVTFISNNYKKAFPFVHELGHCLFPSFISVKPYYNMTLTQFIEKRLSLNSTISKLVSMSLDISKGIEVIHNIEGGPFYHTNIGFDSFVIDNNGKLLITGFHHGKFQKYFFPLSDTNMLMRKCNYCSLYKTFGKYKYMRSPQQLQGMMMDESVDIYSASLVIYSLFHRYSMPFALKEIIRSGLSYNPLTRPTAKQFRKKIEKIYNNLTKYTRNAQTFTSQYLSKSFYFEDKNDISLAFDFPEFENFHSSS